MPRVTVTFKHLVEKCREAYDVGHLAAQNREHIGHACQYFYYGSLDWCHCAIGAGLPPKMREEFLADRGLNDCSISGADFKKAVKIEATRAQREHLKRLQIGHDRWLQDGDESKPKFDRALAACEATL